MLISLPVRALRSPHCVASFFSLAALSEPGIIFSAAAQPLTESAELENGTPSRNILCQFCRVERPWNASHCYDCGVCIEDLDHHCPVSTLIVILPFLAARRAFFRPVQS